MGKYRRFGNAKAQLISWEFGLWKQAWHASIVSPKPNRFYDLSLKKESFVSKRSKQVKIHKWQIINAPLVWIRRGYFDLIAKFVSIWQVYPYKGDGYIKLYNNCFSDYLPSLQWIKYSPEEILATSNHFLLGREYLIYVYSSNYQGGNLVYSHQPFVNLAINSMGINKL